MKLRTTLLVLVALAILAAACSGGWKPRQVPTPTPTTAAAEATPTATPPRGPQLYYCPPELTQAICDFAAAAEGWVQARDIAHLVGAGAPQDTPEGRAALLAAIEDTLTIPVGAAPKLRSVGCADAPPSRANCAEAFGLTFATITENEVATEAKGILVLGYKQTPSGPQLSAQGVPDATGRIRVLTGSISHGCEVPGSGSCLGYRIYPVEVLAAGQSPYVVGAPETIAGIAVKPLKQGPDAPLPTDVVVFLGPVPYATDSNPVLLWREYRDPTGKVRRDDLFANAQSQLGPLAIVDWAADERMGEIVFTSCPASRCRGTGVGGWAGEFDVYRSTDGGVAWANYGRVPAMAFPEAVASSGTLMTQFLGREADDSPIRRFFYHPSGQEVAAPAANTYPRVVPGIGLVWEPTPRNWPQFGAEPTYDAAGRPISAAKITPNAQERLIARFADGSYYVAWQYVRDRPADPHPTTAYVGRIDPSGKVAEIFSSNLEAWREPYAAGAKQLVGNVKLPVPPGSSAMFDVPAVLVDLARGEFSPLRELNQGLDDRQQPMVARAVPGRVARVVTGADCLNVRQEAAPGSKSLGCFRDGVLLFDRGETTAVGGITWVAVTTPTGQPGWASAEFLERRPD